MKRTVIILSLIFALAIALSVSIPTLAADDTGTTTISGTLGAHIDITANTSTLSLDTLIPDQRVVTTTNATVSVKCNKAGWTLDVAELTPNTNGRMANTTVPATELINSLEVLGGDLTGWASISGTPQLENNGAKTGGTPISISNIQFGQTATYADDPGDYTITVTFTATTH